MKNKSDKWQTLKKQWQETFGEPYVPKKMTEDERKNFMTVMQKFLVTTPMKKKSEKDTLKSLMTGATTFRKEVGYEHIL